MPESSASIEPFIHRKVIVLQDHTTALEAAKAMCGNRVGCVIVSDGEGHMIGMLTDRDLCCALVARALPSHTTLHHLMTRHLIFVHENATVGDVVNLMKRNGIRRIPVVRPSASGTSQRCVGIVTLDDLIASERISYDDASQVIRTQMVRRQLQTPQWILVDAHADAASEKLFIEFERRSGLSEERAVAMAALILGYIVRRMHYTDAAAFISIMPNALRSELLDLPAGPDVSIKRSAIIRDVSSKFDMDGRDAEAAIQALWEALSTTTSEFQVERIGELLPDDLRGLFIDLPEGQEIADSISESAPERL